jgi:hypothetical protein
MWRVVLCCPRLNYSLHWRINVIIYLLNHLCLMCRVREPNRCWGLDDADTKTHVWRRYWTRFPNFSMPQWLILSNGKELYLHIPQTIFVTRNSVFAFWWFYEPRLHKSWLFLTGFFLCLAILPLFNRWDCLCKGSERNTNPLLRLVIWENRILNNGN